MESVLISLLILALVAGLVWWVISVLPIEEAFKRIAYVLLIVIIALFVILKVVAPLLRTAL